MDEFTDSGLNIELLDDDVKALLEGTAKEDATVIETEEDIKTQSEINAETLKQDYGLSLAAMEKGVKLQDERLKTGKKDFYTDVYETIIKPNKSLNDLVIQNAQKIGFEKRGEGGTPGFYTEEDIMESYTMLTDKMYDTSTEIQQKYATWDEGMRENIPPLEAMLMGGIDDTLAMDIEPRFVVELLGPSQDIELKKSLVRAVIERANPDVNPANIKVGTFAELSPTYKGKDKDKLAYRIGANEIQPVNVPGMDTKDLAMVFREAPGVVMSIIGGWAGSPGGIAGSAYGAARMAALAEVVTNSVGFAYSLQASDGEVNQEKIEKFIKNALKDTALIAGLEGSFGIVIPGLARVIKRMVAGKKLPPKSMIKGFDEWKKAGGKVDNESVAKINKILIDELGKDAPQIDITVLQAFKGGALPITKKAMKLLSEKGITQVELAQTQIIKETSDAFQKIMQKTGEVKTPLSFYDRAITDVPTFTQSPKLLFGSDMITVANKITKKELAQADSLFTNPFDELNMILKQLDNAGTNPNAVFNPNLISKAGTDFYIEAIEKGNKEILDLFTSAGIKLDDPLIKPNEFRSQAYAFLGQLRKGFFKNMDKGQKEALEQIIKDVSVFTKGTPGKGKLKTFSYNELDSLLNQLNDIIDNPNLYGALAKKNKAGVLAGKLRDDMYKGIERQFAEKLGSKAKGLEAFTKWKNIRSQLKTMNEFRNGDLLQKVLNVNEVGVTTTSENLWRGLIGTQNGKKQLTQIAHLFDKLPQLSAQKSIFKEAVLGDLHRILRGDTGDLLEQSIKNKDFKKVNQLFRTWIEKNGDVAQKFFEPEEWANIKKGGITAVDTLKKLTKSREKLVSYLDKYTLKISAWDNQEIYSNFKKKPDLLAKFLKEGVDGGYFDKNTVKNFKKYAAMRFNDSTLKNAGEGIYLYDPKSLRKEVIENNEFYRTVFGESWLKNAEEVTSFMDKYYSPAIMESMTQNEPIRRAVQNIFLGQLDRKRTFIRGFLNLLGILDARDFARFLNYKTFKDGYKWAHLSPTSMNLSQVLESSSSGYFRGHDEDRADLIDVVGDTAIQGAGLVVGAGKKVFDVGKGLIMGGPVP
jgi:hypothetical protein